MEYFFMLIFVATVLKTSESQEFTYDAQAADWGSEFKTCKGKHQSPINIDKLNVKKVRLPTLVLHNFDKIPNSAKIDNNGHTAHFTIESDNMPTISGGPLTGPYRFEQFHYHWGSSETQINGMRFPMELHAVFYKQEYCSMAYAMGKKDGLAVMGFFFELSNIPNPAYNEFSQLLYSIKAAHTSAKLSKPLALQNFVVKNIHQYYVYNGSLTTPPCSEVVTWLDFHDPIQISIKQYKPFWKIEDPRGKPIAFNIRPVQPIGDRVVWYTSNKFKKSDKNIYDKINGKKIDPS